MNAARAAGESKVGGETSILAKKRRPSSGVGDGDLRQSEGHHECLVDFSQQVVRQLSNLPQNVLLPYRVEIATFDDGRPMQTRGLAELERRINEHLSRLSGMADVAGDHDHDRVCQTMIVAVVLDDKRRPILPALTVRVGKLDNHYVAALH
jgi:hypothetical protein